MARRRDNAATARETQRDAPSKSEAKPVTRSKATKGGATRATPRKRSGHDDPASDASEVAACIATLEENGQVAAEGEPLKPGQTHRLVRGAEGKVAPVRKRFSSI